MREIRLLLCVIVKVGDDEGEPLAASATRKRVGMRAKVVMVGTGADSNHHRRSLLRMKKRLVHLNR